MNKKLRRIYRTVSEQAAPILVSIVFISLALLGANYATQHVDNNLSNNETNQSVLNQSKYYDTEDKVCRSPDINMTNKSQLKACVYNQNLVN